mgnify:CR=1 FL=1
MATTDQNYTSFPAVTTDELLSVLHELNLSVTAEDAVSYTHLPLPTIYSV